MEAITMGKAFRLATAEIRILNYMDKKLNKEKEDEEQAKKAAEAESVAESRAKAAASIVKQPEPENDEPLFGKRNRYY